MDIETLKKTQIFEGMDEQEIQTALDKLSADTKKYRKGAYIFRAGTTTEKMGLVLKGSVTIENNDLWGNRTILSHVEKGQFFAETYGYLSTRPLLVDVVANEASHILFLKIGVLNRPQDKKEPWCTKLILNLLTISMQKNLMLSGRSFQTSPKTIRGRVMSYLGSIAIQKKNSDFDIPFDRQQMADYLNLERTALSKELGKMKKDGLIDFHKNHFTLLAPMEDNK